MLPGFLKKTFLSFLILSCPVVAASAQGTDSTHASEDRLRLTKPISATEANFSGDRQHPVIGERTKRPLRVQVTVESGSPVSDWPVRFQILSQPRGAEGTRVINETVRTGTDGIAETFVIVGDEPGEYEISAIIDNGTIGGGEVLVFNLFARESDWWVLLVIGLAGGLGIFLYGMNLMSQGMKKAAGARMRSILSRLTYNRVIALGVGAFVTMIIQSSSATTVMLVGFVQAGLMSFAQTLGIILGADIGTTVTAQIIAFKLTEYALLLVAIGFALFFLGRNPRVKDFGETTLGFGLIFFGMHVMSGAMEPLRSYDVFLDVLVTLENPVLGILVGMLFTALIQASGAFVGILIVLSTQGLLTLEAAVPLIFGANIGTCITALLAGIDCKRQAKRVALAHTAFKIVGVLLFVWWIPQFSDLIRWLSPKGAPGIEGVQHLAEVTPRQIANAHTVFNVAVAFLLLPITGPAARFIERMLPDVEEEKTEPYKTRYLDTALLRTPVLALSVAKAEVLHMGDIVKSMVEKIVEPFVNKVPQPLAELHRDEEKVDFLDEKINEYLSKISQQSVPEERISEVFQTMYTVTELELMADIVSKTLYLRAKRWVESEHEFSEEGKEEILDYHLRTVKQISRALSVFAEVNLEKARRMKRKQKKYRSMEIEFMRTHYERLRQDVAETVASREYHQDLLEQLSRITAHATNIARILLEWSEEDSPTPELQGIPDPPRPT